MMQVHCSSENVKAKLLDLQLPIDNTMYTDSNSIMRKCIDCEQVDIIAPNNGTL